MIAAAAVTAGAYPRMQLWFRSDEWQLKVDGTAPWRAWRFTAYQLGTIASAGLKKLIALAWPSRGMFAAAWRSGTTGESSAGRSSSKRQVISEMSYTSRNPVEWKQ